MMMEIHVYAAVLHCFSTFVRHGFQQTHTHTPTWIEFYTSRWEVYSHVKWKWTTSVCCWYEGKEWQKKTILVLSCQLAFHHVLADLESSYSRLNPRLSVYILIHAVTFFGLWSHGPTFCAMKHKWTINTSVVYLIHTNDSWHMLFWGGKLQFCFFSWTRLPGNPRSVMCDTFPPVV